MPSEEEQQEELKRQKDLVCYTSAVNAWYSTALEHDKSILTLSAGGVGLILTLLTSSVGVSSSEALILYILAILSFLVALIAVLWMFRRNKPYLQHVWQGTASDNDSFLACLDTFALCSFGAGVLFSAVLGVSAAVNSFVNKEKEMAGEKAKPTQQAVPLCGSANPSSAPSAEQVGVNGAVFVQKSFNGAPQARPQAAPTATNTAPAPAQPQSGTTGK